jgi:hypothetical protein
MNKIITLALVAGLAPFASAVDLGGNMSVATAQASVTILAPVVVTAAGSLQFGKVVISGLPTTIAIDGNAHVTTDAKSAVFVGATSTSVPTFTITKDPTASVDVTFLPNFTGATFVVNTDVITGANAFGHGGLSSYTAKPLYGSLTFSGNTMPNGVVSGSISITANYI